MCAMMHRLWRWLAFPAGTVVWVAIGGAHQKMKTSTAICTREHSAAYFFQKLSSGWRSFGSASVPHSAALSRCFTRPTPACGAFEVHILCF